MKTPKASLNCRQKKKSRKEVYDLNLQKSDFYKASSGQPKKKKKGKILPRIYIDFADLLKN